MSSIVCSERRSNREDDEKNISSAKCFTSTMVESAAATGDDEKKTNNDKSDGRKMAASGATEVKLPPDFPLDHGWAWIILAGHFAINFLLTGLYLSMSIFLVEFVQMFQVPVSAAASVMGVMSASNGIGNVLVTHVLLPRIGPKATVLIGACTCSLFTISLFFSPNMIYVNIAHIFIGASLPFMNLPSTTLLGHYFRARLALAMSLGQTGISLASITFPPLIQYFISSFGPRGALLLAGGLQLHTLAAGLLMRPVSYYNVRKTRPPEAVTEKGAGSQGQKATSDPCEAGGDVVDGFDTHRHTSVSASRLENSSADTEADNVVTRLLDDCDQPASDPPNSWPISQIHDVIPEARPSSDGLDLNVHCLESSSGCPYEHHTPQVDSSSQKEAPLKDTPRPAWGDDQHQANPLLSNSFKNVNCLSTTCEGKGDPVTASDSGSQDTGVEGCRCISTTSLYRSWLFWLLLVYVPLMLCYGSVAVYFPSLAVSQGVPRSKAALLLSVSGGVGLVSRVILGYLADLKFVRVTHIVAFCLTVVGVAAQFCRFYTSFGLLVMMAVIQGMLGHAGLTLNTVVIIDLMGLQHLPKVLGFVLLANAGWSALNHPLIGAIVDASGSFAAAYNYIGACLLAAAFVLLMVPVARRLDEKRLKKTRLTLRSQTSI